MAPLVTHQTKDNEQWERLEVLPRLLQKSISLHRNGSTPVTMTEQSLYNLTTAGTGDFLEIVVSKVIPSTSLPLADKAFPSLRQSLLISFEPQTPPTSTSGDLRATDLQLLSSQTFPNRDPPSSGRPKSWITLDTRMFLSLPDTVCGNCQRAGHTIRDCVGPVDDYGEIDGCPKCNTRGSHIYDNCPFRETTEDFDLIYRYRQRKPPLKSFMTWQSFLSGQHQPATWPKYIPWSTQFSIEQQQSAFRAHRKPEWCYYEYDRIGWPDAEAHYREIDSESEFMVL
ncbi:hypothetical protein JX266_009061 [Neoarthrinium moseri]|nr:hypothetical protein JX266_009061 [Neoarthrinium moseri]